MFELNKTYCNEYTGNKAKAIFVFENGQRAVLEKENGDQDCYWLDDMKGGLLWKLVPETKRHVIYLMKSTSDLGSPFFISTLEPSNYNTDFYKLITTVIVELEGDVVKEIKHVE